MNGRKPKPLNLTEEELRRLQDLCVRDVLRQLHHGAEDPTTLSLLNKSNAAITPEATDNVTAQLPG